jgi:peptidoglycan-N-acetylmuramic acid deacetylase
MFIILIFIFFLALTQYSPIADSLPQGMLTEYVEEDAPDAYVEVDASDAYVEVDTADTNAAEAIPQKQPEIKDVKSPEPSETINTEPLSPSPVIEQNTGVVSEHTGVAYEAKPTGDLAEEDSDMGINVTYLPFEGGDGDETVLLPNEETDETEETPVIEASSNEVTPIKFDIPEVAGYPELDFGSPYESENVLSNAKKGWYFNRNKEHVPPSAQGDFDIRQFDAYYLGDTSQKTVYLTFDEGYENGYTSQILDILKEKGVTAAFFVTKPYITSQPDLINRMISEGHLVANHSDTHPSFPGLSDEQVKAELTETAQAFKDVTGLDMPMFFRPPMGEYSARTLAMTMQEGYKTIFWSFAYADWDVNSQKGKDYAYEMIMNDLHNGQIMLLHAVSQSNTEALGDVIDSCRANGFEFKSLYDLP